MLNESISLGKRQLVDTIWKATGIEGLGTTFSNTERILENLPVETSRDEVLFVVNMKRAFNFVFDNIDYPISLAFLREVNKISMDGLIYNSGAIRNIPVGIGGTSWQPEMPNEGIIINDLREISSISNPFDRALEYFCYIARSQMFLDGNKRLAQIICNKSLMESDMGILSIPYDEIGTFKEKLLNFYETNNSSDLKAFLMDKCLMLSSKGIDFMKSLHEKEAEIDDDKKQNEDPDSDDFVGLGN